MPLQDVDWGASDRVDEYHFELVDPFTLATITRLDSVYGASSLTWAYDSDTGLQGTLDLGEGDYLQGGYHRMVRVIHDVTVGGRSVRETMGTLFVANVTNDVVCGRSSRALTCYGPLWRYTQDVLPEDFSRAVGTNVVQNIRDLVESVGGKLRVMDGVNDQRTNTVAKFFPVGTNLAEVLRTYAGWLNAEIRGGDDGTIELLHYESYADRSPVYTFADGTASIATEGVKWETNRDEPINRVVAYFSRESKQKDDTFPLSDSCYIDLPESASVSYERCGRRRTQVVQVTEPCSHADLIAQAQRAMDQSSAAYLDITFDHAGVPGLRAGDCVHVVNSAAEIDANFVILQMRVSALLPGCPTQSKMRMVR